MLISYEHLDIGIIWRPFVRIIKMRIIKKIGGAVCFLVAAVSFSLAINTVMDIGAGLIDGTSHFYRLLCIFCSMLAIVFFIAGEELWKNSH